MDPAILTKPLPEIEEWFLARVEETPLHAADMLTVLKAVGDDPERRSTAESWAEFLHERLKKDHDMPAGVALAELRGSWLEGKPDGEVRAACEKWLADLFSREAAGRNFIPGAGFRDPGPPAACFRRLRLLMNLKPGAFCVHKSWGPGTVKRLDDFYSKVVVDFAGHPNHELSYAFVADSLELPGEDHLLAIQHRDPAGLQTLVRDKPADVVRIALRSFGAMPVARLQETLCPAVLPASAWKAFWESARKALLAEGDCEIPGKKLEPLRLIDRNATPAQRWAGRFRDERRLEALTALFEELAQDRGRPADDPVFDGLLRDKMAAVLNGAEGSKEELVVRAVLAGKAMGLMPGEAELARMRKRWLAKESLKGLLNDLPVRLVQPFIRLVTADLQEGVPAIVALIPLLHLSPMAEAIDLLRASAHAEALRESLCQVAFGRHENIRFLFWMAKNLERVREWDMAPLAELPFRAIEMLRGVFMYEDLRAANGLRALLTDKEWLQQTVGLMDEVRRMDFLRLVREPDAAMYYDAQALLGRLIVVFPELAAAFQTEETRPNGGLTSWRSYTQRQRQLEHLLTVEIPRNARDIEVARSYGDLRENHEYKTAKEAQAILMRRKEEMQRDLQTVKGTDFERFPMDVAGMGVQVEIEFPDGARILYNVLGEWDQDESLRIISCQSGLGIRLAGLKPGDPIAIPDGNGVETPAKLAAVRPLPPEIKQWVRTMDAP